MSGSSAAAAVRALRDDLQAAVACVTHTRLATSPGGFAPAPPDALPYTMTLGDLPVRLAGPSRLALATDHHYRLVAVPAGGWRTSTAAYLYTLFDEHGRELLAYHWHPGLVGQERVSYPHLHVGPGAVDVALLDAAQRSRQANALRPEFHRLHLPTRRIALEDVVGLLIEQFQVTPMRADWSRVLQGSRERFEAMRTWV